MCLSSFFASNANQQRFIFDDTAETHKKGARGIIKALFEVIQHIQSEEDVMLYALCQVNGILEDLRSRVSHFVEIMNHFQNPVNLVQILLSFLRKDRRNDNKFRDIASHICALLIE